MTLAPPAIVMPISSARCSAYVSTPAGTSRRAPGLGSLDYRVLLTEMDRLDPDTPLLVEHLPGEAEYRAAVAHIRAVADALELTV